MDPQESPANRVLPDLRLKREKPEIRVSPEKRGLEAVLVREVPKGYRVKRD